MSAKVEESQPPGGPILLPSQSPESSPFWDGVKRGVLTVQRCLDTGRLIFPPRPRSPYGSHRPPEWIEVSGQATIWSFVVPHPPLTSQFELLAPYGVIVVALEEDERVRMVGNLVRGPNEAINSIDPASIRIGDPVEVIYGPPSGDGLRLPLWRRRADPAATPR